MSKRTKQRKQFEAWASRQKISQKEKLITRKAIESERQKNIDRHLDPVNPGVQPEENPVPVQTDI